MDVRRLRWTRLILFLALLQLAYCKLSFAYTDQSFNNVNVYGTLTCKGNSSPSCTNGGGGGGGGLTGVFQSIPFGSLPSCNAGLLNRTAVVPDSLNPCVSGNALAGGGVGNVCLVGCNGIVWAIMGTAPGGGGGGGISPPVGQIGGTVGAPITRLFPDTVVSVPTLAVIGGGYVCNNTSIQLPSASQTGGAIRILGGSGSCIVSPSLAQTIQGFPAITLAAGQGALFTDILAGMWEYDLDAPSSVPIGTAPITVTPNPTGGPPTIGMTTPLGYFAGGTGSSIGPVSLFQPVTNGLAGTQVNGPVALTVQGGFIYGVCSQPTDTDDILGIADSGSFVSGGIVNVQQLGNHLCTFDGPTMAKDYVTNSLTTPCTCTDAGNVRPANVQVLGRVGSTNATAGNYSVNLYPPSIASVGLVNGYNSTTGVVLQAGTNLAKPWIVRGAAGQLANLEQWQDSTGAVLSFIDKLGQFDGFPHLFAIQPFQLGSAGTITAQIQNTTYPGIEVENQVLNANPVALVLPSAADGDEVQWNIYQGASNFTLPLSSVAGAGFWTPAGGLTLAVAKGVCCPAWTNTAVGPSAPTIERMVAHFDGPLSEWDITSCVRIR